RVRGADTDAQGEAARGGSALQGRDRPGVRRGRQDGGGDRGLTPSDCRTEKLLLLSYKQALTRGELCDAIGAGGFIFDYQPTTRQQHTAGLSEPESAARFAPHDHTA